MLGLITAFDGLPPELIAHAVARGRFCELLAPHVRAQRYAMDLFFAGLFSRADTMMGVPIAEALAAIPMSPASRTAVLEPESAYGPVLLCAATGVPPEAGAAAYVEALAWTDQLLGAGST
jgi:EAL and modified HD-GYP domain-containing signal transduction protein